MGEEYNCIIWQPPRLQELAIDSMVEWISGQAVVPEMYHLLSEDKDHAEALISGHVEAIRQYLDTGLPLILFNEVAQQLFQALDNELEEELHPDIALCKEYLIARLLEVVYSYKLKCLDISYKLFMWTTSYPLESFHLLTGLTELYIHDSEMSDCGLFESFSSNVMRYIVQNCKLLEVLDLQLGRNIDNTCVDLIAELPHLKTLNLNGQQLSKKQLKQILMSCKHITHIDCNNLQYLLLYIAKSEDCKGHVFTLKRCCLNRNGLADLQKIFRTFPELCDVTLPRYSFDCNNIRALSCLRNLQTLEIKHYEFYKDAVREMLQEIGKNLTTLHLANIKHMDTNALHFINQTCPNLHTLRIDRCYIFDLRNEWCFCKANNNHHDISRYQVDTTKFESHPFKNLINVSFIFGDVSWSSDRIPEIYKRNCVELVSVVLSNSVNVQFVEIKNVSHEEFPEMFTLECVEKNPMNFLKQLSIYNLALSWLVVDRLLENSTPYIFYKYDITALHEPKALYILRHAYNQYNNSF